MNDTKMKVEMTMKRTGADIAKITGVLELLGGRQDDAQVLQILFDMEKLLNHHLAEYRFHIHLSEPETTGGTTANT